MCFYLLFTLWRGLGRNPWPEEQAVDIAKGGLTLLENVSTHTSKERLWCVITSLNKKVHLLGPDTDSGIIGIIIRTIIMHAMLSSIPKQCGLGMGHVYEVRIKDQNKSLPGPSALASHSTLVR